MTPKYIPEKFRELVLYVAAKSIDDPTFGQTKLAKLLFYADFRAYATLAGPITGSVYERWEHGPFPPQLYAVERELTTAGDAFLAEQYFHAFTQARLIARRKPDLQLFTAEEIALVDGIIAEFWGDNATAIEWRSHQHPGWKAAANREAIPYTTAFLSEDEPSNDDIAFVESFACEHGLLARA
jgi:uncharacterized phage-associated protein